MTVATASPRYTFNIPSPASISSAAKHQHCAADTHSATSLTPAVGFSHVKAASLLRAPYVSFSFSRSHSHSPLTPSRRTTAAARQSLSAPVSRRSSIDLTAAIRTSVRSRSVSISTSSLRVTAPTFTPRLVSSSLDRPSARSSSLSAALAHVKLSPSSPQSAPASLLSSPTSPHTSIASFFTSTHTPSLASLLSQSWSSPSSPAALDLTAELLDECELPFDMSVFDVESSQASKCLSLPERSLLPRVQQRVSLMAGRRV